MSEYRKRVVEYHRKGLNAQEIAKLVDRSVTSVHSAIQDAKKHDGYVPAISTAVRRSLTITKALGLRKSLCLGDSMNHCGAMVMNLWCTACYRDYCEDPDAWK